MSTPAKAALAALCLAAASGPAPAATALRTSPGERVLELLAQVKANTAAHEEVADRHESTRAGICENKQRGLAGDVASVRTRLAAATGEVLDPSAAEQNATEAGRANATAAAIGDNLARLHREQDIKIFAHQLAEVNAMKQAIADGFSGDLAAFSTAATVRQGGHEMYTAHQERYDSYARTLESVLALMERHFTAEGGEGPGGGAAAAAAAAAGGPAAADQGAAAEREWQSEMAERLYAYVSTLTKGMDTNLAMERALEKESADAWNDAATEREQLAAEADAMIKQFEGKAAHLEELIRSLGGAGAADNSTLDKPAHPADPAVITALRAELSHREEELRLWQESCGKQADIFVAAQHHRTGVLSRLEKLETWIQESLMTANSVVGASNPDAVGLPGQANPTAVTPEQRDIASRAYDVLKAKSATGAVPLAGDFQRVTPNTFHRADKGELSGTSYDFDVETTASELVRIGMHQRPGAAAADFSKAEVLAAASVPADEIPKALDVAGLQMNIGGSAAVAADGTGGAAEVGEDAEDGDVEQDAQTGDAGAEETEVEVEGASGEGGETGAATGAEEEDKEGEGSENEDAGGDTTSLEEVEKETGVAQDTAQEDETVKEAEAEAAKEEKEAEADVATV